MKLLPELAHQRLLNRLDGGENLTVLHEEIYRLLVLLLPKDWRRQPVWQAHLPGKPPLQLQIRACFTYTDEIALSYMIAEKEEPVVVRLYHDAKVAELHHYNAIGYSLRRLGPVVSSQLQAGTRRAQNAFLLKWLDFLLNTGYQHATWSAADASGCGR